MIIREIEKKDVNSVYELVINYKKELGRVFTDKDKESLLSTVKNLPGTENSVTLIAVENNKTAGFLNAHFFDFPIIAGKECYISDLLIDPEMRGKSIGKKLLDRIEKISESKDVKRMMLINIKEADSYKRKFYAKTASKNGRQLQTLSNISPDRKVFCLI